MGERTVQAYPVYLQPAKEGGFCVRIPDFDQYTQGGDLAEAIYMARDAIGMMGVYYEDEGIEIPAPNSAEGKLEENEFLTYVDVDFIAYRLRHNNKMVKKNCTIPAYLEEAAEKQGINFSRVLSEALALRLNLPTAY